MTKDGDYSGEYYYPHLQKVTTVTLKIFEQNDREMVRKGRAVADAMEQRANQYLYEQNYRKHIKTLKPLVERDAELRKIINDPKTSKTAKKKAEREFHLIDEAFWGMLKFGKEVEAGR